ncbi:MAG: hypothetical protein R2807_06305 [Chitinophagales bacterium]
MQELKEITTVTLILFAIIDILGSVPIILDIKSKVGHVDAKYATAVFRINYVAASIFR